MQRKVLFALSLLALGTLILAACAGPQGAAGPQGPAGPAGPPGPAGNDATLTEEQTKALETAANLAAVQFPALDEVRRGCPACHVLVDPATGQYTLPYEAHERVEAMGEEHPDVAPDGTSLKPTDEVKVTTCLLCHAPGTGDREGMGVVAPLSLRDIVHPAHMNSQFFKLHYGGNCFTCHNVGGDGSWYLLTDKVDVNEKGVPNHEKLPIPGAIKIGAGSQGELITRGGLLYDKWWAAIGADEPTTDQPLWKTQTTNTRSGADTWRCKECHGWDYKGVDGAYGSGSHKTGFAGILATASLSETELAGWLTGKNNRDHDFSAVLDEGQVAALAAFVREGLQDTAAYINSDKTANGDAAKGKGLFDGTCAACHGADGKTFNFGDEAAPEYVGTIAADNPWEFFHKVSFGQPGTAMPSGIELGWTAADIANLLAYAQTLPTK